MKPTVKLVCARPCGLFSSGGRSRVYGSWDWTTGCSATTGPLKLAAAWVAGVEEGQPDDAQLPVGGEQTQRIARREDHRPRRGLGRAQERPAEQPGSRLVEAPVGHGHRRIDRLQFALQIQQVRPVPGQEGVAGVRLVVGVVGVHVPIALVRAESAVVQPGQGAEEPIALGDGQGLGVLADPDHQRHRQQRRDPDGRQHADLGIAVGPARALEPAEDPEVDRARRRPAGSGPVGRRPRRSAAGAKTTRPLPARPTGESSRTGIGSTAPSGSTTRRRAGAGAQPT